MSSTKKKIKRPEFIYHWELEYGIKVASKDLATGKPLCAVCLFCRAFGRDDEAKGESARKRTTRIMSYEASDEGWRTDKFLNHNRSMHEQKWAHYQSLSHNEKIEFFETGLSNNTNIALFKKKDNGKTRGREIFIRRVIVDTIVVGILHDKDGEDAMAIKELLRLEPSIDEAGNVTDKYCCKIANSFEHDMILKNVGRGLSFRQVVETMDDYRESCELGHLYGAISSRKVTIGVRIFCAEAFQAISDALSQTASLRKFSDKLRRGSIEYGVLHTSWILLSKLDLKKCSMTNLFNTFKA